MNHTARITEISMKMQGIQAGLIRLGSFDRNLTMAILTRPTTWVR